MQKNNGFPKAEKLKKSSEIDLLFKKGKTKSSGDLRIVYMKIPEENLPAKSRVGVSVSKKNFKRAVDRNRIKRLLRESYRLNKENFAKAFGSGISAMIIWKSSRMPHGLQETERIFLELCTNEKINTQNL